ncbi:hypothetical protein SEA_CHERRYONLIM_35 [Gordonia phage CherryonLim]|uniref:Uncharacterized protein n=2 Tax=Ponsvirus TaxID=3044795 RepID=A0A5P8D9X8_9CAUD|nr:hypothetical protein PP994_gp35 [Gordonia phage CherryonLim]YP_010663306.1 hypothetical protein PP996_gp33 [Gordonia phage SheckWes]QDM56460.1 hypothetical protein SEA_SHECKWES_33 [Gordonia phage SheckWes]QFP95788.1 hypothetical protein SEA_CHERRYONLIM_35 [Gordonia phage CherryonLim]
MSNTIAGTATIHAAFVTRKYEGVARYDHDVTVVPGTYDLTTDRRIPGQYLVKVNARRVDNGELEQHTLRIYTYDVDNFQQRNNATIVLH